MTQTSELAPVSGSRGRRWATVGWALAVLGTAGTGLLVGYASVWFQLFGDTADADDYETAAGAYGAAALLLLLAVPALLLAKRRTLACLTGGLGVLYVAFAADAIAGSRAAEPGSGTSGVPDGIGVVLLTPVTWPLLLLSLLPLLGLRRARPSRG